MSTLNLTTPQEQFWGGAFGDEYVTRCQFEWRERIPFFVDILCLTGAGSVMEVGCNWGANLLAIKTIDPSIDAHGIDVNENALDEAVEHGLKVFPATALEVGDLFPESYDLVLSSGCLIHIPDDQLHDVMRSIIAASKRYVLAIEYEAEADEAIIYRGHSDRLWKRPFGKLYLDLGLKLIASGDAPDCWDRCVWHLLERPI